MAEEVIFSHIEKLHGDSPWGHVLDAGTGSHSLGWIASLPTARWTAVTADPARVRSLEAELGARRRAGDRVVCGNWSDAAFLHDERFDVVLADYLIGAVDYFAPYSQDVLLERLRPHVAGRLYVVGLEPYPEDDRSEAARLVLEIARLRDACILHAGQRPYREFPLAWTLRQLERAGYAVDDATSFPIIYGERFVRGQLDVCLQKLPLIRNRRLTSTLEWTIDELRDRALSYVAAHRGLRFGEDYVVAARSTGS